MEYRFSGDEVCVRRDDTTGDIVLSTRPGVSAWKDFFELTHSIDNADGFMDQRPMNRPPADRDSFADEA